MPADMDATINQVPGHRMLIGAPDGKWTLGPPHSLSALWIVWADNGNPSTATFWSRDWAWSKGKVRKQRLGIARFERYLIKRGRDIRLARIFDVATNQVIIEYRDGNKCSV